MMRSEWPVGRFSSLEAMEVLTMKPTPASRLSVESFPNQKSKCASLWKFSWPEEQNVQATANVQAFVKMQTTRNQPKAFQNRFF